MLVCHSVYVPFRCNVSEMFERALSCGDGMIILRELSLLIETRANMRMHMQGACDVMWLMRGALRSSV